MRSVYGQINLIRELTGDPREGRLRVDPVSSGALPVRILAGVDSLGRGVLAMPLASVEEEGQAYASVGLQAHVGDIGGSPHILLRSMRADLDMAFGTLAEEMVNRFGKGDREVSVATVLACIGEWEELLKRMRGQRLTDAQLAGLLAELLVVRELVERVGAERAWAAWAGPDRQRVDFLGPVGSLEVKATLQKDGFPIRIHGLYQLTPVSDLPLFVRAFKFDRIAHAGLSVPVVVEELQHLLPSSSAFMAALRQAGYDHAEADQYRSVTFDPLAEATKAVDGEFPRLAVDLLQDPQWADQLRQVEYTVDVGSLPSVGRSAAELIFG